MITLILAGILGLTILFLISAILQINKLQHQVNLLDREQHNQNEDIIRLMKTDRTHSDMLVQHIEILKYLVEQDPALGKQFIYSGPIGEA